MSPERMEQALTTMDAFALGVDAETIRDFMNDFLGHASLGAEVAREA
jgi:hypothetical protein